MQAELRRHVLVALALIGATLPALPAPVAAEPAGCRMLVQQAESWIDSPEKYMESPRKGDYRLNEPLTVYAEVDHYEMVSEDATPDGAALGQTMVPVYRSMSLGGVLLKMRNTPLSADLRSNVVPAWAAISAAWDAWANGDASKPVPYDAAKRILVDAEERCNTA